MVTTRSQSRAAALAEASASRVRQLAALQDYPAAALQEVYSFSAFVGPQVWVSSERLTEIQPQSLPRIPAIEVLPRRWIVERFIFGEAIADSLPLGACTSSFVVHTLEVRRSRRFASGVLSR